jgi:hypothetical protein
VLLLGSPGATEAGVTKEGSPMKGKLGRCGGVITIPKVTEQLAKQCARAKHHCQKTVLNGWHRKAISLTLHQWPELQKWGVPKMVRPNT